MDYTQTAIDEYRLSEKGRKAVRKFLELKGCTVLDELEEGCLNIVFEDDGELVFAICIRLSALSCILAPPEDVIASIGSLSSSAFSIILVTFSPTTLPIEPPIKSKSITAAAIL